MKKTEEEKRELEILIGKCLLKQEKKIFFESHLKYLKKHLYSLPEESISLDSSRPWIIYWSVNAGHLLGYSWTEEDKKNIITSLEECLSPEGGFGGNKGQIPHLGTTYAAISTLSSLNLIEQEDNNLINRKKIKTFLLSLKRKDGSFHLYKEGEVDLRGVYCSMAICSILNILEDNLIEGVCSYIKKCQGYEGGLGGVPGDEAHAGYTFCGIAALGILKSLDCLDLKSVLRFCSMKQDKNSGGMSGRTNKLVDGCYSFWAVVPICIIIDHLGLRSPKTQIIDTKTLQVFILSCCQTKEGFRDKPGVPQDILHTFYCLGGLSAVQMLELKNGNSIFEGSENSLEKIDMLHGLCKERFL